MYAPLMDMPKRDVPYEEALEIVRKGLRPMGEDYLKVMNDGIEPGGSCLRKTKGRPAEPIPSEAMTVCLTCAELQQ